MFLSSTRPRRGPQPGGSADKATKSSFSDLDSLLLTWTMRKRCQKCPLPEVPATQPGRMNPQTRGQGTTTQHCGTLSGGAALCQGQSWFYSPAALFQWAGAGSTTAQDPGSKEGREGGLGMGLGGLHTTPHPLVLHKHPGPTSKTDSPPMELFLCLQAQRLHLHRKRTQTGRLCVLPPRSEPTSLNAALLNCQGTWGHEAIR